MSVPVSFLQDYGSEILRLTIEHSRLTAISVGAAILFSVPTGIILTRARKIAAPVLAFASIIQTIPSLALFGLVIPILIAVNLPIIGFVPAFIALFLYALLPILRNTHTGIRQVDPAIIEAATGIGMTDRQILWRIELPLSMPVIMAGIRTSTVISVGVATLAALIGAGGLGELIFRGLRTINYKLMLAGAIPAAALAMFMDFLLGRAEIFLTPKGLKIKE
ncbi:MAG: ABC transporter permease [Nitrospirota bacterium]|nr:ABC transporter permease [Nitrospirota bacterium]